MTKNFILFSKYDLDMLFTKIFTKKNKNKKLGFQKIRKKKFLFQLINLLTALIM